MVSGDGQSLATSENLRGNPQKRSALKRPGVQGVGEHTWTSRSCPQQQRQTHGALQVLRAQTAHGHAGRVTRRCSVATQPADTSAMRISTPFWGTFATLFSIWISRLLRVHCFSPGAQAPEKSSASDYSVSVQKIKYLPMRQTRTCPSVPAGLFFL